MITFNAHRGDKLLSKLIRLLSRGNYNHVSIELRGHIYEAHIHIPSWIAKALNTFFAFNCFREYGVLKTPVELWDNSTVVASQTLKISPEREEEVYSFLEKQVGKKYDTRGILSFLFIYLKPRMGYFYCSELAVITLYKAFGMGKEDYDELQNVSPHLFWIMLKLRLQK